MRPLVLRVVRGIGSTPRPASSSPGAKAPRTRPTSSCARWPAASRRSRARRSARAHSRPSRTCPTRRRSCARITKRLVTYKRADGVDLSFMLYLPPGIQGGHAAARHGVGLPARLRGRQDGGPGDRLHADLPHLRPAAAPLPAAGRLRNHRQPAHARGGRCQQDLRHLHGAVGRRRPGRGGQGRGARRGGPRPHRHRRAQPRRSDDREPARAL